MNLYLILIVLGIALLAYGGDLLVSGAVSAAKRMGVSPLLTGIVIVGIGTSAPELVVSVDAALNQKPDIAIGNVVGSNISNILLVLGLSALISPMVVKPMALKRDAVTVVASSLLFILLLTGQNLGRLDAAILLGALAAYLVWAYMSERQKPGIATRTPPSERKGRLSLARTIIYSIGGLVMLLIGSRSLLYGSIGLAEIFNISEAVIGLTLVAVGTSLPELAIAVVASLRRHADVIIGNILGSNIFNLLGILGISALLQPLPVHERILLFDQWMILGTALLLFFLYTGRLLNRFEGGFMFASYVAYIVVSFTIFN